MERPDSVFLSYYSDAPEPAPALPTAARHGRPPKSQSKPTAAQPLPAGQHQAGRAHSPERMINISPTRQRPACPQQSSRDPQQMPQRQYSPTKDMRQSPTRPQMAHHPQQFQRPPHDHQQPLPLRQQASMQQQPPYRPAAPQGPTQAQMPRQNPYNAGRPQLQVQISHAPDQPSQYAQTMMPAQPPRAAFVSPPPASPAPSTSETLVGSPIALKVDHMQTPLLSPGANRHRAGSTVSKTSTADQDRFGHAGGTGQDFWKRFSMVVKDVEDEKRTHKKDEWLEKSKRSSAGLKRWVWIFAVVILAAVGGGLAYHFTRPDSGVTTPSKHDFGLGPESASGSSNPLATLSVNPGPARRQKRALSGFEKRHRSGLRARAEHPLATAV